MNNNNDNYKTTAEELEEQLAKLQASINDKAAKYELLKQEYKLTGIVPEGMKQCPKCAELLFEDANYCPKCEDLLVNIINEQRNPNNIIINNVTSSNSNSNSNASAINNNSNVNIKVRRKYNIIFDLFMICITSGLWLIWMLIRPKYY